jgi:hypothetical protein
MSTVEIPLMRCRCGDTVPSTTYGFLPFTAFKTLIDIEPTTIYVMTDPAARTNILSSGNKFQKNCRSILQALFDHLKSLFPSAIVAVKSGGDPFLDYVRLMKAKVTICSGERVQQLVLKSCECSLFICVYIFSVDVLFVAIHSSEGQGIFPGDTSRGWLESLCQR